MTRKQTTLYVHWSKKENDFQYCYPNNSVDGHMLHQWFGPRKLSDGTFTNTLYEELEKRGYDTTTLKFSVKKKPPPVSVELISDLEKEHPSEAHVRDVMESRDEWDQVSGGAANIVPAKGTMK